ncbi:hypothetical protein [Aestuariibaculum suncheonense]|uniref:Uncharacterized protein n=1 Tax=Aestuariibaculum suncheonense TaxID=1028745 RepID=A0A8J6UA46_9FLAO|nr:hypothetical protein [Aestuariibaculum suncheonense]MBD0834480.1 hypothetical protein [Aestuariibaculum suncheonense]
MSYNELKLEVENYSKKYGQILVGIHNDLVDYKNKVNSYSKETSESLIKCAEALNICEELKFSTQKIFEKIEGYDLNIKKNINSHQKTLSQYKTELNEKFDLLEGYIHDFEQGIKIIDELKIENLELNKKISSIDSKYKIHSDNFKKSISGLEDDLEEAKEELKEKENKIKKLESYRLISVFAISLLYVLFIIKFII